MTPPRNYQQWATLIHTLVAHWVERYGVQEVAGWFFEVWNEPNLEIFWTGTRQDYFTLYQVTADAIKRVDRSLRVGGPATARDEWIEEFLEFCRSHTVPVDFVSTHHYPNDVPGYEDDDTETQLAHSHRGMLREWTLGARRRAGTLPLYYTEWNSSSNPRDPRHDEPYAAAFVAKTVLEASELVQGYSFWTFSDIFEENSFPSRPFHGGFGLLTIHGIAKPTYRAFELLHELGNERLLVDGRHETVNAWVTRDHARVTVLLVNHAVPRHSIAGVRVRIHLAQARQPSGAWVKRIDEHHANAKRRWQALGSPEYLDATTVKQLQRASRRGTASVSLEMARGGDSISRSNCPRTPSPPSPWSSSRHDRAEDDGPASRPERRRRAARTLQRSTFRYFWEETNPANGLISIGLIWQLMRRSRYVVTGLRRAGFRGGWLAALPPATRPSLESSMTA